MSDLFQQTKSRKKINPLNLKASDIRTAMTNRWASPEWAIMWEVGDATGANGKRYADAVMMSLWPSRGLELHGVEIKISRADWKREAADPSKAEAIGQYCDRWWIHTPEGVVDDLSDLPPLWGLREWTGKRWMTIKEAGLRENAPDAPRSFLASMLRRADGLQKEFIREATAVAQQEAWNRSEEDRKRHRDNVKREVERRTSELTRACEQFQAMEEAMGAQFSDWSIDGAMLGRAARALCDAAPNEWSGLKPERLRSLADEVENLRTMLAAQDT